LLSPGRKFRIHALNGVGANVIEALGGSGGEFVQIKGA
jgi:hypothetical protein